MSGVVVFRSLSEALRAGYHVYERTTAGYLVRTRTKNGWAMAIVICSAKNSGVGTSFVT